MSRRGPPITHQITSDLTNHCLTQVAGSPPSVAAPLGLRWPPRSLCRGMAGHKGTGVGPPPRGTFRWPELVTLAEHPGCVGLGTEWKSTPIHLANVLTAWDSFQRIALIWADRRPAVWRAQDGDPGINRSHWGCPGLAVTLPQTDRNSGGGGERKADPGHCKHSPVPSRPAGPQKVRQGQRRARPLRRVRRMGNARPRAQTGTQVFTAAPEWPQARRPHNGVLCSRQKGRGSDLTPAATGMSPVGRPVGRRDAQGKQPVITEAACWMPALMEMSGRGRRAEAQAPAARGWGGAGGADGWQAQVSFGDDENVLESDSGDSYMTVSTLKSADL